MAQSNNLTEPQLPLPETFAKKTRQFFPLFFLPLVVSVASVILFEFVRHYTTAAVAFLGAAIFCIFFALYVCSRVNKTMELYKKAYRNAIDKRNATLGTGMD